ncbi:MAG: hypothetical protein ABH862_07110, partial [Candidatus Omnitrophota bacterium]
MRILSIKIISLVLVSTLFIQSASWASATGQEMQNIQAPSILSKITTETNWQYEEQARVETAIVLAAKQNTPFHIINDAIDQMYEGTGKARIIDVLPLVSVGAGEQKGMLRQIRILHGSRKGEMFTLPSERRVIHFDEIDEALRKAGNGDDDTFFWVKRKYFTRIEKKSKENFKFLYYFHSDFENLVRDEKDIILAKALEKLYMGKRAGYTLKKENEEERPKQEEKPIPGRKLEYDEQGRITKVYDTKTGIRWEEYEYGEDGRVELISLYNPCSGKRLELFKEPLSGDDDEGWYDSPEEWVVFYEGAYDEDARIGKMRGKEEEETIELQEITIFIDKEMGNGKTIIGWLALQAHRKGKSFGISDIDNPVTAGIAKEVYIPETVKITLGKEQISFTKRSEMKKFLLEQEYFFMTVKDDGLETQSVTIEKGTGKIILGDEWPEKHTAFISNGRLRVTDKEGKNVKLLYAKHLYLITGQPDEGNLVRMQDEEAEKRRAEQVGKLYKETAKEIKKETQFDQEKEEKLRKFFYQYIKTADKAASIRGDKDRGLFIKDLRAEDIADMFYLNEIYGFNIFDFLEKGRTKWDKKNGKKEDQYEFELDGEYCTRIKGHNSGGEKIDIGHAVC